MAFDELLRGDLTDLLYRPGASAERQIAEGEQAALDSLTEGSVVRWQTRFDDSHLLYTFTVGERCYCFAWESYWDEAHRVASGETEWYDAIAPRARFEVRYRASHPARHSAQFGQRQIAGTFLQIRSTLRDAFREALPTADFPELVALVDRIRSVEQDDLTFLLARALLAFVLGLPREGLREQIKALEPRYAVRVDSTEPHDGACHRFAALVHTLVSERPSARRSVAGACLDTVRLIASPTFQSHCSMNLLLDLVHLFRQYPETQNLVPRFAELAPVLTPEDDYYDDIRAELQRACRH